MTRTLDRFAPRPAAPASRELAAEAIALSIRWFGLVVGLLVAAAGGPAADAPRLHALLAVGLAFTAVDSVAFRAGRVFLRDAPLAVSALEAVFIGLLCHAHAGPGSPFRFYYLLSLTSCAVRYSPRTTFLTCGLDLLSYAGLYLATPPAARDPEVFLLTLVILVWVTWAAGAMARLLKRTSDELRALNDALTENQAHLESRIRERSRELEDSQAQVLHGEKMAAFGLLAAGIAHEVGNPLTAISNVVQMLERRDPDAYTRDKLRLVTAELTRIQTTLRELVQFSRPASDARTRAPVAGVVGDALRLAKFYKGGASRRIVAVIAPDVPDLVGVRDQFVQVVFNLVLNAIDATAKDGAIEVTASRAGGGVRLEVKDDGPGIPADVRAHLFHPYFTTKKHGTGLGLFVTRRVVEGLGGRVEVASDPGKGAAFTVTLPAGGAVDGDRSEPAARIDGGARAG